MAQEPGVRAAWGGGARLSGCQQRGGHAGGRGAGQGALCFCSSKRSPDTAPQKQPHLTEAGALGQGPDDGLLVTHVNQTQDLLVKPAGSRVMAGGAPGVSLLPTGSRGRNKAN